MTGRAILAVIAIVISAFTLGPIITLAWIAVIAVILGLKNNT